MPAQTPARRFLPPSSAPRSLPPSSSRFTRTPHESSSPFSRTPRFKSSRDVIEDVDDDEIPDEDDSSFQHVATNRTQHHGLKFAAPSRDQSDNSPRSRFVVSSISKRRRTDQADQIELRDEIISASSESSQSEPEDWKPRFERVKAAEARNLTTEGISRPSPPSSSPAAPGNTKTVVHTPRRGPNRFITPSHLIPKVQNFQTDVPFPSFEARLLGAATQDPTENPYPPKDFIVPDAFSPSHRRGKKELYIRQGSAEFVRSLVLDIAARSDPEVQRMADVHMQVTQILLRDPDDRFVLVEAKHRYPEPDSDPESSWLLINTDDQASHRAFRKNSKLDTIQPESVAIVRVGHATWTFGKSPDARTNLNLDRFMPFRVGVLWDATVG